VLWGVFYGIVLIIEKLFLLKHLEKAPGWVGHVYTMVIVILNWVIFANTDIAKGLAYIGSMFGSSGVFADRYTLFYLRDNLLLLLICTLACTPIAKKKINFLRRKPGKYLVPALTVIMLVICTAFIVDASYNPFLYFRF
jgi:alginate O-acetyltransferase complex protein AlgI